MLRPIAVRVVLVLFLAAALSFGAPPVASASPGWAGLLPLDGGALRPIAELWEGLLAAVTRAGESLVAGDSESGSPDDHGGPLIDPDG